MTTLILVRHAQSAPAAELPEDAYPLSETGRRQARELAPVLAELGVDGLASSPYLRAIDTLQPYADAAGLAISIDADLRERSLGGWLSEPAMVEDAVRRMHADPDCRLEGGESARECRARLEAALGRLVLAHPGRTIAAASHGAILSHLLAGRGRDLPEMFWRRIRNPHLFVFDTSAGLTWVGERTLDGSGLLISDLAEARLGVPQVLTRTNI